MDVVGKQFAFKMLENSSKTGSAAATHTWQGTYLMRVSDVTNLEAKGKVFNRTFGGVWCH